MVCTTSSIRSALLFYTNHVDVGQLGWRAGHFWSLSVEEHFYLLWPCLLVVFGVLTGWRTAIAIAITVSLWRIGDNHFHILSSCSGASVNTRMQGIILAGAFILVSIALVWWAFDQDTAGANCTPTVARRMNADGSTEEVTECLR